MHRQVKLHLLLKSYNYYYIKNALLHLSKTIEGWNVSLTKLKYIPLPEKRQKITVLKSPHVHKKAREQFELLKAQSCVEIKTTQKQIMCILLLVNHSQFPGVEIRYKVKYNSTLRNC